MNMKILLNILPEENKKAVRNRKRFRFFLWQIFLVLVLEIIYVSILATTFFVLSFQIEHFAKGEQTDQSGKSQETLLTYQQKFRDMNSTIEMIMKINANHLSFSQVFLLLDTLTPDGIIVDHLTTKDYTILLTGKAKNREDLLLFDRNLKESSCIERTNVPISNLFSQENIDFQIDFDIKNECLKKISSL